MIGLKLAFDAVMVAAWLRTLLVVGGRPTARYQWRWIGKAAALFVAAMFYASVWGYFLPLGALAVWWKVVVAGRDPFELPMADGRAMS